MKKIGYVIVLVLSMFIFKMFDQVNALQFTATLDIDSPYNGQVVMDELNFRGWVMSEDENRTIRITIDGEEIDSELIKEEEREDVLNAIKGYGGKEKNKIPGYKGSVDISHLSSGTHQYKVEVVSNEGIVIGEKTNNFVVRDYETKMYIDNPVRNEKIKTELNYQGWVMSEDANNQVEIYIDGEKQDNTERYKREDVLKAISGYGGREANKKPGFRGTIDTSDLKDGVHTFTVRVVTTKGRVLKEETVEFNIYKYDTTLDIDSPYNGQVVMDELNFRGWVMSEDENRTIRITIDGEEIDSELIKEEEREDVLNAIKGYGGKEKNKIPGYKGSVDISHLSSGTHQYKVEVVSNEGIVIGEKTNNFVVRDYETKMYIDSPVRNEKIKTELNYQGWVMSEDANNQVEIYIDGEKQDNTERYKREDVLKAISGYGGREANKKPGFRGTIDTSDLKDGVHTFTVRVVTTKGRVLKEETVEFNIYKYDTTLDIDSPYNGQVVMDELNFRGWVMSEDENRTIRITIDGEEIDSELIKEEEREDVLNAIKGYGGKEKNKIPGYKGSVDISHLSSGTHQYKVEVVSNEGIVIGEKTNNFVVRDYETKMYIDSPVRNEKIKTELNYQGWVMSEDANNQVEIYIDGEKQDNTERYKREDVLKAISGYGGREANKKPGFRGTIDTSDLKDGVHTFTVRVVTTKGRVLKEETVEFNIYKYDTTLDIDSPYNGQVVMDELNFRGWVMSEDENRTIRITIDGEEIDSELIKEEEREDVLNAIKGYGGKEKNKIPGYKGSVDISHLSSGTHQYKVEVVSNEGIVIGEKTNNFVVRDYETKMYIDSPVRNEKIKTELNYQGWVMSEDANNQVEIYIDGEKQDNTERYKREDVLKAISGYGGREANKKPGFRGTIDTSDLKDGVHTFTVRVVTTKGRVLKEETVEFNIYKYDTKVEIEDFPNTNLYKEQIYIRGWVMSEDANNQVEIYIDGEKKDGIKRNERQDVLNNINGYGGKDKNKTPGFEFTLDYSDIKEGTHEIEIRVISPMTDEILFNKKSNIFVRKYDTKMDIDSPLNGSVKKTNIDIQGWVMSEDPNGKLELYINDTKIDDRLIERYERQDVIDAIVGYGGAETNKTPGFRASIDSTNMKDGLYAFTVKYISSETDEIVSAKTNNFYIKKYGGIVCLDSPVSSNFNDSVKVVGWGISELEDSYIKVYIDNYETNTNITRLERDDVLGVYGDAYGGTDINPLPGFEGDVDLSYVSEGKHIINIYLYTKYDELIGSTSKEIYVYKNKYFGIDVSSHNTILDWSMIKNNGYTYAMIRAGVRGYGINSQGIDGNLLADEDFYNNVRGATSVGMKVGAYVFSQAINEQEAIEEANLVINMVNAAGGKNTFAMPIVFDSEFSGCKINGVRCGRADGLSKEQRTNIAIAFLETVKNAGYTPMIYASSSFLVDQLDMNRLANYEVWVAHYGVSVPSYNGAYQMWQYTSTGSVPGISGNVDLNEIYKQY